MCSRYGINKKLTNWMHHYASERRLLETTSRDIHPTDIAPVLVGRPLQPTIIPMIWGMERKCNGGLTINARVETLWERPMFSYSIHSQRCILPASHFYEWDVDKHKATFYSEKDDFLFLAGIYSTYNDIDHFVIITQPADEVMLPVHERMPVCIPLSLLQDWLYDNTATKKILATATVPLVRKQNIQQLSLWQ
jgi:putative SOS response-associated peptidase YedK